MKNLATLVFLLTLQTTFAQITPICEIQGDGASSPLVGSTVNTTGIVTGVFKGSSALGGFFIEVPDCDGDDATSDGIFVYDPNGIEVEAGDSISLTGEVSEFFGLTELSNISGLTVAASSTLVPITELTLPFSNDNDLEALEGMNVRFSQELTVTDHFNWARFGELIFSFGGRLVQPTNSIDPNDDPPSGTTNSGTSNVMAITSLDNMNDLNRILVDDGKTGQYIDPPPFMDNQGTVRAGSTASGLTGPLSYGFGSYRLMPTAVESFDHATRPDPPFDGTDDLQVVSFNVLNYWTTIGGWGAQTNPEFGRQQEKLVMTMAELQADVFGLMELENNGATAYQDLLDALNDEVGNDTYAALDAADPGAYPTKSVIFYKPETVTPAGPLRSLNDPIFERPTLSQIFEAIDGGGRFNYVLNHLRFKGCDGASGPDLDQGDGQACFNETRRQQAFAVLNFIDTIRLSTGIDQILIGGDFNAYAQEDPIDILEGAGYNRLLALDAYSFSFFGQWGALDHAFASNELVPAVTGAAVWHVNADEPRGLGWEDASSYLYQEDPYRSSDHDPVCVTLDKTMLTTSVEEFSASDYFNVFPNPFTDKITFQYEMTYPGNVRLELFDPMGRMIAIPLDEEQFVGSHSFDWECSRLTVPFLMFKMTFTSTAGDVRIKSGKLQRK